MSLGPRDLGGRSLPVYSTTWAPAQRSAELAGAAGARHKGGLTVEWALAGEELIVATGDKTLEGLAWLERPCQAASHSVFSDADFASRLQDADFFGLLRLGMLGHRMADNGGPVPSGSGTHGRLLRILERLGDCEMAGSHRGEDVRIALYCQLTDKLDVVADDAPTPPFATVATTRPPTLVKLHGSSIAYAAGTLEQIACRREKEIRSDHRLVAQTVIFENAGATPVSLLWVDFDGHRVPYGELRPGQTRLQKTFVGHYWVVADHHLRCQNVLSVAAPRDITPPLGVGGAGAVPDDVVLPSRLPRNVKKSWRHTSAGVGADFVRGVKYSQQVYVSQRRYLDLCRRTCWRNFACLGFFEQTHLCPDPAANDGHSDPNQGGGHGCYRICGFFDQGEHPLRGQLSRGPRGSVWLKADAIVPSRQEPGYAAAFDHQAPAP